MLSTCSHRSQLPPFYVMRMLEAANRLSAQGHEVLHMSAGQPGTPAPRAAREAVAKVVGTEQLGYTESAGTPEFRRAIVRHYADFYGLEVPEHRIIATMGASAGFLMAMMASFDKGARVGMSVPGYSAYRHALQTLDLEVVDVRVGEATRFQPTPEVLDACGPLDGLILASPSNPSGTLILPERLAELEAWSRAKGTQLIVDELYHGLTYEQDAKSILELTQDAIVLNSFSKYFSMTGWRIGWMVVPERLAETCANLAASLFVSPPHVSQVAAIGALGAKEELAENLAGYARRREILLKGLPQVGFPHLAPVDGGFYIYARTDHLAEDSLELAQRLLNECHIAVAPGIDFDPHEGHRYLRFSFAGTDAVALKAIERLRAWAP